MPFNRLKLYLSMVRYGNAHNRDFAREHCVFFKSMLEQLQALDMDPRSLRVLDVGCGKAYWLTLLLHSYGANATGIDTEFTQPGCSLSKYLHILRENGLERTMRSLVWDIFYAGPYYRQLGAESELPLRFDEVDARRMGVTELDFPDDTFDLVVSHEVFEHIAELPAAVRSLRRALKPSGITYIYVHNFTSLSGGHHIAWKYPDTEPSTVVPPWDHLRQNRYPDIPSWVNKLRERNYRHAFEEHFNILEWHPVGREGEALLTPEIQAELSDYSRDELLTKGFVIIARPKATSDNDGPEGKTAQTNKRHQTTADQST